MGGSGRERERERERERDFNGRVPFQRMARLCLWDLGIVLTRVTSP